MFRIQEAFIQIFADTVSFSLLSLSGLQCVEVLVRFVVEFDQFVPMCFVKAGVADRAITRSEEFVVHHMKLW